MELDRIKKHIKGESVLNIGFSINSDFIIWKNFFGSVGFKYFDVLEGFEGNIEHIKKEHSKDFGNIYHSNVKEIDKIKDMPIYDVILWFDGPEHVECNELPEILSKLEKKGKMIILRTCHGPQPRNGEIMYGNKLENHLCAPKPEMFSDLGYYVKFKGIGDGNDFREWILAWKWTEEEK